MCCESADSVIVSLLMIGKRIRTRTLVLSAVPMTKYVSCALADAPSFRAAIIWLTERARTFEQIESSWSMDAMQGRFCNTVIG